MFTTQLLTRIRTVVWILVLAFTGTPLLHANDLFICKQSNSQTSLAGQVFTFKVSGGTLVGTKTVTVPVGQCVFVAQGPNLIYSVVEQPKTGTLLTSISAIGTNNGHTVNALISENLAAGSAQVQVFTGNTFVTFTNTARVKGFFTGGGSIFTILGVRITHGMELHCSIGSLPNNLEINWNHDRFHLESLASVSCFITSSGVAVIEGTGTGTLNGVSGYTITFTFTDAGEPGRMDFASYLIKDPSGLTVLPASGLLEFGNQQFHPTN
jgi:hypothetical protein